MDYRQKIVFKVPLMGKKIQTTHRGTGPGEEYYGTTASASHIIPSLQTNGGTGDPNTEFIKGKC